MEPPVAAEFTREPLLTSLKRQDTLGVVICRAQSFPRQNLTNSAANFVNSAAHCGNTDEIPRLTAVTPVKFHGVTK